MSTQSTNTTYRPGDVSERAARSVLNRRRRRPTTTAGRAHEPTPANSIVAGDPLSQARRPTLLRRWSVADLIAQAAARAPLPEPCP
jgi:hypothetical protein